MKHIRLSLGLAGLLVFGLWIYTGRSFGLTWTQILVLSVISWVSCILDRALRELREYTEE